MWAVWMLPLTHGGCCHLIRYRPVVIGLGMSKPSDLLQGTLDLLILRTLALEPMHGWAIAARIQQTSQEVLQITQGALYPALHRLEQQGWLRAKWRKTETGREAKFYTLTAAGRAQLEKELAQWERLSGAVGLVIRMAEE
jgi:PadR family transcriptional regulator PadR